MGRPQDFSSSYISDWEPTGGSGQAPRPWTVRRSEPRRASPASRSRPSFFSSCWRRPPAAVLRGLAKVGKRRVAASISRSSSKARVPVVLRASQRARDSATARSRSSTCRSFSAAKALVGMNTSPRTSTSGGCPSPSSFCGIPSMRSALAVTSSPVRPSPRVAAVTSSPSS